MIAERKAKSDATDAAFEADRKTWEENKKGVAGALYQVQEKLADKYYAKKGNKNK